MMTLSSADTVDAFIKGVAVRRAYPEGLLAAIGGLRLSWPVSSSGGDACRLVFEIESASDRAVFERVQSTGIVEGGVSNSVFSLEVARADLFVDGNGRPDQNAQTLLEVFHLEEQHAKEYP